MPLGLGSDWFVAEPDPLQALRAAALRDGPEALSPEDALVAHTAGAARSGLDDLSGVFAPDSNADLVVLSADPTTSAGLATARVLRTSGGRAGWRGVARLLSQSPRPSS